MNKPRFLNTIYITSIVCFVLSTGLNIATFLGFTLLPLALFLGVMLFVSCLLSMLWPSIKGSQWHYWKIALKDSPKWHKILLVVLFLYTVVIEITADKTQIPIRIFSAAFMFFFGLIFTICYSKQKE